MHSHGFDTSGLSRNRRQLSKGNRERRIPVSEGDIKTMSILKHHLKFCLCDCGHLTGLVYL